jgi:hypothetical protein
MSIAEDAMAPMPVIVGVGRSGTTLLRLMLDAHPELAIPPETGFLIPASQLAERDGDLREALLDKVTGHETWPTMGIARARYEERLRGIEPFDVPAGIRAFYRLYAERFGKARWGDKTPYYNGHIDKVQALLPEARFIHMIRDGRDVALSFRGLWFSPGDVANIARRWMNNIGRTRRLAEGCPHYLEVRYERLVESPEEELRRVCEFVELPYETHMERYHETSRERLREMTPPGLMDKPEAELPEIIRLATKPPQPGRIQRWRREMPARERQEFERVAGATLDELGYGVSVRARARRAARTLLHR